MVNRKKRLKKGIESIGEQIGKFPRRNVSEKQLAKDLEELKNAS